MKRTVSALLTLVIFSASVIAEERPVSWVTNGGFEHGPKGWSLPVDGAKMLPGGRDGRCIEIQVEDGAFRASGFGARQDVYVGTNPITFTVAVDMKTTGVQVTGPGGHAYAAVYQLSGEGDLVASKDFGNVTGDLPWTRYAFTFQCHPEARFVSLRCGIWNAAGTAWFDNWTMVEGKRACLFSEVAEMGSRAGPATHDVGIFREPGFPASGHPCSPEALEDVLEGADLRVRFLSADELGDPTVLQPSNVAIVVLPYGANFPASAREAMTSYLHAGGHFISMGGYAFNNLLVREEGRWLPETKAIARRLEEAMQVQGPLLPKGGFEAQDGRKESTKVLLNVRPGRIYRFRGMIRTENVTGTGFAYMAVYQYDAKDKLVKWHDFAQVRGTQAWKRYEYDFSVEPTVARVYLNCGLYQASGKAWFDDFRLGDITGLKPCPMNTSTGAPEDGLRVGPTQIGIFDADYRLQRVAKAETAPGQHIFPEGLSFGPVQGWAASAVRGNDNTRWIPLLAAYDRYGRSRGSAGSLVINYAGFYSGSQWAYFGVEDQDLFSPDNQAMAVALQRLVQFMLRGVYLRNLSTAEAGYWPGEEVALSVIVENRGPRDAQAEIAFKVFCGEAGKPFYEKVFGLVPVACGGTEIIKTESRLPKGIKGLCRIAATLKVAGEVIDEMESGFVALAPLEKVPRPSLNFVSNYFNLGHRPIFLFGSDNYSNVYTSATEGPLWWAREHDASRDFGFQIYENLQYSNPGHKTTERDWRRFHAMAQLTEERGLVFMPGLLIGHNVAVSDEEIAAESAQCREYSARLKGTPALLWYINGDYQLRHSDLDVLKAKWNASLRQRYGTTQSLREAWAPEPVTGELGELPFPPANTGRWESVSRIDLMRFHVRLMRDWNEAHVEAIRSLDATHPITSEYYQSPFSGIDLRLTIDGQDVSNIGYFDEPVRDIDNLPLKIRWNDLRAQGKSVGLGEYGVKTHPAWEVENGGRGYHIRRTPEQQRQLFMAVAHYAFGMGASKVQNWCLRDSDERVFPWGVFYPGPLVPKDVAYTHRNLALLMRLFAPRYEAPPLTVLICDNMRLGNHERLGIESAYRAFAALLGLHVDFNVVSDSTLGSLPETTKAVIYPSALCPPDEAIEGLIRWVEAGGKLLVTGDFGYDPDRRHTRAERLLRLAGVRWLATNYPPETSPNIAREPLRLARGAPPGPSGLRAAPMAKCEAAGAAVLAVSSDRGAALTSFARGKGKVFFLADSIECFTDNDGTLLRSLYAWFLHEAGIASLGVEPDDPSIHVFAQPTRTGTVHVVFNCRLGEGRRNVTLPTKAGKITLGVRDRYGALAAVTRDGAVIAIEGHGHASIAGEDFISGDVSVAAAALDGSDVRTSEALLVLPFGPGKISISRASAWTNMEVILGDIRGGGFVPIERVPAQSGSRLSITLDEDSATLVGLVCRKDQEARWMQRIASLITSPEQTPGM